MLPWNIRETVPDREAEAFRRDWQAAVCRAYGVPPQLICHSHTRAAIWLYKICGLW